MIKLHKQFLIKTQRFGTQEIVINNGDDATTGRRDSQRWPREYEIGVAPGYLTWEKAPYKRWMTARGTSGPRELDEGSHSTLGVHSTQEYVQYLSIPSTQGSFLPPRKEQTAAANTGTTHNFLHQGSYKAGQSLFKDRCSLLSYVPNTAFLFIAKSHFASLIHNTMEKKITTIVKYC